MMIKHFDGLPSLNLGKLVGVLQDKPVPNYSQGTYGFHELQKGTLHG